LSCTYVEIGQLNSPAAAGPPAMFYVTERNNVIHLLAVGRVANVVTVWQKLSFINATKEAFKKETAVL